MRIEHHPTTDVPHPPRTTRSRTSTGRRRWRLLLSVVALLALAAAPKAGAVTGPLQRARATADPSVAKVGPRQYVAVATGQRVTRLVSRNGQRWRAISPALASRPAWARPGSAIWAADVARVGRRWLLYFAAPVRGMGASSRCIGVAASRSATGRFRPVGRRPLVCPPAAHAPRAEDRILDRHRARPTYPTIGAIDPSVLVDRGRVFLLYKTDGMPSSIRLLPLRRNGLHARGRSRVLLAARGVLENPVMVRRGRWLYLFLSQGDYSRCSYSTVWRRSRSIRRWRHRPQRTLLARRGTGLCGPGGADVVVDRRAVRLYFHGWTCRGTGRPCAEPFHSSAADSGRRAVRVLYGARLRFTRRAVRVASFIGPHTARPSHRKHHGQRPGRKHPRATRHRRATRHLAVEHHRAGKQRRAEKARHARGHRHVRRHRRR